MKDKSIVTWVLVLAGVYFLIFHTEPFPFNHDAIGLPPYHMAHAAFGVVLLGIAVYMWKKK